MEISDSQVSSSTASFKNKLNSFLFHAAYARNTVWTLECAVGLIVGVHYKSLLLLLLCVAEFNTNTKMKTW